MFWNIPDCSKVGLCLTKRRGWIFSLLIGKSLNTSCLLLLQESGFHTRGKRGLILRTQVVIYVSQACCGDALSCARWSHTAGFPAHLLTTRLETQQRFCHTLGFILKPLNTECINIDHVLEIAFLDASLFCNQPLWGKKIILISPESQGKGRRFLVTLELTVFWLMTFRGSWKRIKALWCWFISRIWCVQYDNKVGIFILWILQGWGYLGWN